MTTMVEIKNLRKNFGHFTAVDNISFTVQKGEVLGFLGPNGAGKSTTMKMITGFLTPDQGSISVLGDDIDQRPVAVKKNIGYLPEGAPAYQDMTPERFLNFIAEIRGFSGAEKKRRVAETVANINLETVLKQSIDTLSKGFKRRVGLAQAILHDPPVLVLDEPTDGLDPNQKKEVRQLIKDMAANKAIILSTHILEEVEAVCTRATIIANGKIVADGTPTQLQQRSQFYNALSIKLEGVSVDDAMQAFNAIAIVESVKHIGANNDDAAFMIFPKDKQPLVGAIHKLLASQKWDIDEFHIDRGRLDDVFHQITQNKQSLT